MEAVRILGNVSYLALQHAAGATGGMLAKKYRLPAGAMIGAMLFAALLNVLYGNAVAYPAEMKFAVQSFSGMIIGSRLTRSDLSQLKTMLVPAAILVVMLSSFNIVFALIIAETTELSAVTALLASAPGGVTDLALIAADFGANTEHVALLQISRFILVISFFPFFMRRFSQSAIPESPASDMAADEIRRESKPELPRAAYIRRFILALAVAFAASSVCRAFSIPAGAVIGSMFATMLVSLTAGSVHIPDWLKTAAQICIGCYVGSQVTRNVLLSLGSLALPLLLIIVEMFFMAFATSWVICRATGLSKATSLFSCIPGGLSEMGMIAEELKLDLPKIILMHTCRVIAVICMLPLFLKVFYS